MSTKHYETKFIDIHESGSLMLRARRGQILHVWHLSPEDMVKLAKKVNRLVEL